MELALDRDSDVPVGVQLAWALRARIVSGELARGAQLPGVRELAGLAGVNANTARAVYARLEADGLLRSQHGRGTFVADDAAVDDRFADAVRDSLSAATSAGVDPRDLAAALFSAHVPHAPADPAAARRRALRDDIAQLERELAEERRARAVRDARGATPRPAGGRLLSEDELRAQRDELTVRLRALREPGDGPMQSPASTRSVTRRGVTWRPVFGA